MFIKISENICIKNTEDRRRCVFSEDLVAEDSMALCISYEDIDCYIKIKHIGRLLDRLNHFFKKDSQISGTKKINKKHTPINFVGMYYFKEVSKTEPCLHCGKKSTKESIITFRGAKSIPYIHVDCVPHITKNIRSKINNSPEVALQML